MPRITIKLFATFRTGRFRQATRVYPDNINCSQVAADIGISTEELGIILVNGKHRLPEDFLHDGDSLSLFPLLGGG